MNNTNKQLYIKGSPAFKESLTQVKLAFLFCMLIISFLCTPCLAGKTLPGPTLRVYVYDQQSCPLHGATVTIQDNWGWAINPKNITGETKADSSVYSPHDYFVGWCIDPDHGQVYKRQNPWDWVAWESEIIGTVSGRVSGTSKARHNQIEDFPRGDRDIKETEYSRPIMAFKIKIDASMDGFESNSRTFQ